MKIVIAMDSFKGTLKAYEACEIIAQAISEIVPEVQLVIKPMADGGEGTARAMIKAANGRWVTQTVMGPLPDMQVEAGFAWFEDDRTALVEMASASGLELLSAEQMNPLNTTTYGTGQLIKAALKYGAHKILLAVGGSATVDGGLGAAMALGWKFLDHQDNPVPLGGAGLEKITKIIRPEKLSLVPVEVLCDVDNPLCGEHGAAKVYAPQKGATPEMVEQMEKGLAHLAELVRKQLQRDIDVPGAGAAGGLAAGAIAFMNATIVSGIETVMARSNLRAELESADWVITGEGSFDRQSLYGKVVSGILKLVSAKAQAGAGMASQSHTRVAVLAGQVNIPQQEYQKIGIAATISCKDDNMSLDYALENSRALLYSAAQRFTKQYLS
ncbi:MAG TPA: glycerate kinase [Sedimentisphaerales bacterium]|nr:glycerate kinase [Sedimentisphaerales bacterium]